MKTFKTLMDEMNEIDDLEELEAAADLFQYGIEKGYYSIRESDEFNHVYWDVKNRCLACKIAKKIKRNTLDVISIVKGAPVSIKNDEEELTNYINGRIKALRGKIGGLK
ncbi:hypothetical protein [Clostridium oryzae]|uniref:Uncharacterized protein n=1 Tax=Clostridium oryzae TaxID=1450648 RepID=A0A1V4IJ21_9CLOT|nr:hypothetical protein [Clostridium oryzae]OPJ59507.1 hypothetical protein CLORY_32550 [Clostridium oryzae]